MQDGLKKVIPNDDDDVPESNGVIEIDDFEDDVIDRILNEYPSEC